jgi:transcriptional regulator with XRE-family HTH domain
MTVKQFQSQAKRIGHYIAEQRKRCGISLCDLGRQAGISHSSLSYIERGLRLAQVRTLLAILSALGSGRRVIRDVKVIGRRIGQLRRAHLLSRPEFAQVIGNSRHSAHRVYDWELGRIVPGMASLVRICSALDVDFAFFFGLTVRLT